MPIHVFNTFDVPSAFTGTTEAWGVNDSIQIVDAVGDGIRGGQRIVEGGVSPPA